MNKTLVKTKIVLEDDGKSIVVYFWKPTILWFGYWYPYGCTTSNMTIDSDKINKINDTNISKLFFQKIF